MKKEKTKRKSLAEKIVFTVIAVILIVYTISLLIPLGWGLLTSLKSAMDFHAPKNNVLGLPIPEWSLETIKLGNYKNVLNFLDFNRTIKYISMFGQVTHITKNAGMLQMIINTLLYAGVGAFIKAIVPAIVAHTCVKYKFKFSEVVYGISLFVLIVPIVGAYPAELTFLRTIGLYDTIYGSWIQNCSFVGTYYFVFVAFYKGLSVTYDEAAELDGASQLKILTSIILPLSAKMIATVWLIQFITLWNDYNTPMMYLPTIPTVSYAIFNIAYGGGSGEANRVLGNVPAQTAACMLLALPILVIFIALKDRIMGSITMGGLKE
jgi:ABC-type glycerol-3-phosphate transport system permease component